MNLRADFTVRISADRLSGEELDAIAKRLALAAIGKRKTGNVIVSDQTGKPVAYAWGWGGDDALRDSLEQRRAILETET